MGLALGLASAVQAGFSTPAARPLVDMIGCGAVSAGPEVAVKANGQSDAMVPVNCPADEYREGLCYALEQDHAHLLSKFGCPVVLP